MDWCCFHRFDARPVFGRVLDWARGGFFRIAPAHEYQACRRYVTDTNVLLTTFTPPDGVLEVTDCMPVRRAGAHPYHQLVRFVRCTRGRVRVRVEFGPRFDYGLTVPLVVPHAKDLALVYGGADGLVLQTTLPMTHADPDGCTADHVLDQGDERVVIVTHMQARELRGRRVPVSVVRERVAYTIGYWRDWAGRRPDRPLATAQRASWLVRAGGGCNRQSERVSDRSRPIPTDPASA